MRKLEGWEENRILELAAEMHAKGDEWIKPYLTADKEFLKNKRPILYIIEDRNANDLKCPTHPSQQLYRKKLSLHFWWIYKENSSLLGEAIYICKFCKKIYIQRSTFEKYKNRGDFLCRICDHGIIINDLTEEKMIKRLRGEEEPSLCSIPKDSLKYLINVEKKRAEVPIIRTDGKIEYVNIPVYYSKNTACCYVYNETIERLKSMGIILCRLFKATNLLESDNDFSKLNTESIIHQYGYNVDYKTNLSLEQRRHILVNILAHELVTMEQLKNHLSFLISLNKDVIRMRSACAKWKEDFAFLDNLEREKFKTSLPSEMIVKHIILI